MRTSSGYASPKGHLDVRSTALRSTGRQGQGSAAGVPHVLTVRNTEFATPRYRPIEFNVIVLYSCSSCSINHISLWRHSSGFVAQPAEFAAALLLAPFQINTTTGGSLLRPVQLCLPCGVFVCTNLAKLCLTGQIRVFRNVLTGHIEPSLLLSHSISSSGITTLDLLNVGGRRLRGGSVAGRTADFVVGWSYTVFLA